MMKTKNVKNVKKIILFINNNVTKNKFNIVKNMKAQTNAKNVNLDFNYRKQILKKLFVLNRKNQKLKIVQKYQTINNMNAFFVKKITILYNNSV